MPMRRIHLLLAIAAALATASPAAAKAPIEIGVQDDWAFMSLGSKRERLAYKGARGIQARVLRINLIWANAERRRHGRRVLDWSFYDSMIRRARQRGLEPQVTITGPAPRFWTGDHRRGIHRPDPQAFGRFAEATARHYGPRVQRWSVWNEPNWPSWLSPSAKAASMYRQLYRQAWRAIKRVENDDLVLFGELAPMGRPEAAIPPLRFLRRVTCRDREWRAVRDCDPLVTDGFAHHPYTLRWAPEFNGPGPEDVTTGSLWRLRRALDRLAADRALVTPDGGAPELYLTEYGWHADSRLIREPKRSRYAVRGMRIAARAARVRQIVWYQVVEPPRAKVRVWDTALVRRSGRPRPIFRALRAWVRGAVRDKVVAPRR